MDIEQLKPIEMVGEAEGKFYKEEDVLELLDILNNRGIFIDWVIEHYPNVVNEYLGFGEKKNEDDKQHN